MDSKEKSQIHELMVGVFFLILLLIDIPDFVWQDGHHQNSYLENEFLVPYTQIFVLTQEIVASLPEANCNLAGTQGPKDFRGAKQNGPYISF